MRTRRRPSPKGGAALTESGGNPSLAAGWLRGGVLCAAVIVSAVHGCSVEKNYALLSFFFDGVPNPNAMPVLAASGDPAAMRASPTYTVHPPYLENRCVECHGRAFSTSGVDSGVCLKCHEGVRDAYAYMHGPVAFGACLMCHVPHESAYPALLKSEPIEVCGQCHGPGMLDSERVPEHADGSASCLDCHFGHGGGARYMLRETPVAGGASGTDGSSPGG